MNTPIDEHSFWMMVRAALLMFVDAIELKLCISPRTSEVKKSLKWDRENSLPNLTVR